MSCDYKEVCDWISDTQVWSDDCSGNETSGLFVMNDTETMFTHTTPDLKSTYYVTSKESGKDGKFTYNIVSDVGNKYYAIFDLENKEVRFVYLEPEDSSEWFMVRWYIKAIF
jgi:hypothetical protein